MNNNNNKKQATCWCFTWNNPTLTPEQFRSAIADSWNAQYCIFQAEVSETGTPHYQGYVEWEAKRVKRLTAVRKLLPTAHWEIRTGTRDQARTYCTPDGMHNGVRKADIPGAIGGPYVEVGAWAPAKQGKRTDLEAAVEVLRENGWAAMVDQHPTAFVKYSRGLEALAFELGEERAQPPHIMILYGPTGCGKSRLAFSMAPKSDRWVAPVGSNGGWFNGYHGHPLAIMDDFAGKLTGYRLDDCLRLFDRYEVVVPVKGGFTNWAPDVICITTNIHPSKWWDYSERVEQYAALQRRVALVYTWGRDGRRIILGPFSGEWQRWWIGPVEQPRVLLPAPGGGPMDDWVRQPEPTDQYSFIFQ